MRFPLELLPGIVSDETTYSTPGFAVDGNNVRFWRGRAQTIGGWAKAHATALTGLCRNLISWTDNAGISVKAFGTTEALQVLYGGTLSDITPSGLQDGNVDAVDAGGFGTGGFGTGGFGGGFVEYYPRTWSFSTWGENLMACPRGNPLYLWQNDTATAAAEVTQSPDQIMQILVTPERQVLAFGCTDTGGDFNWLCIRGSAVRDYTDWTPSATSTAFEHILESEGKFVAARQFGAYVAVWTESSLHIGEFIGDPASQIYRFDRVAENCGCAGPNAVTVINQTAYWLTPDLQFYAWQIGSPPQPITCRISNDFKDNITTAQIAKVVCTGVSEFNEVWWFYPDSRDGTENSRYVAVSLVEGLPWFRGQMARTAAIDSGPQRYPLFVDTSGYIHNHEYGNDADGSALSWFIETGDIYIGNGERRVLLKGIWPDFEDQTGDITLTVKVKPYPADTAKTVGPWTLKPGRSKRDFMVDTRIAAFRFAGNADDSFARLGKPVLEYELTGMN